WRASWSASADSERAAAVASSTIAAFCCVTPSISLTAVLTCWRPVAWLSALVAMCATSVLISPIRRSPSDDADALKARLYAMLPRVRITDLLVEVAAWSGFADRFVH
ncbi:hypothetical protein MKW35_16480, partial [Aestuariibaculum sp. L182]|nr:hypothetical protein [Aestuariibaculum lutulentum]